VLLAAGADPNDGQTLYNRMFEPDDDHLEVLFEFGLGLTDGTPWRRRSRQAIDSPAALLRSQLSWAITHGMSRRVRLLLDHGADISLPLSGEHYAADLAAVAGHPDLIDELIGRGSPALALDPVDGLIAAALAADRQRVDLLLAVSPELAAEALGRRPALVAWAATLGRPDVVELVVELGFDINAKGRTDVLSNQKWQTALHQVASVGDLELAGRLLELGADPDSRDKRFDATPLDWAEHFGKREMVALLEPVTGTT
jgi:ankyrin repeat protein